ncbi:MAG: response regulator [Ignavibacteriaceae bacterium]|jgi:DNA-binding response OmpR family regulator
MMNKKNNILVCSGDLNFSIKIKSFLEEKGMQVLDLISSGDELIECALNFYPSLIITDITLKGEIDGIETISRISGITKIPYIFIADSADQISLIQSYYLYPVKVFAKPVDLNDLYFFVNDCVGFSKDTLQSSYFLG